MSAVASGQEEPGMPLNPAPGMAERLCIATQSLRRRSAPASSLLTSAAMSGARAGALRWYDDGDRLIERPRWWMSLPTPPQTRNPEVRRKR
jgi:hypothetical protein